MHFRKIYLTTNRKDQSNKTLYIGTDMLLRVNPNRKIVKNPKWKLLTDFNMSNTNSLVSQKIFIDTLKEETFLGMNLRKKLSVAFLGKNL